MGLFDRIREPVFLKEDSSALEQLKQLRALLPLAGPEARPQLERDIKILAAGVSGEEHIAFELRNSHIPMLILHDLYLQHEDLTAQIDYLILTRRRHYILECKNLFGDIEMNGSGDFIRTVTTPEGTWREGIYSPVTQNRRHLELVKQIRAASLGIFTRPGFLHSFYDRFRSVVVLSNPKTVLAAEQASDELRQQVIRADQLIAYIQRYNGMPGVSDIREAELDELAQLFLGAHKPPPYDYVARYRALTASAHRKPPAKKRGSPAPSCPKCGAPMVLRKAKRGSQAGTEFYGCSNYPSCTATVSL